MVNVNELNDNKPYFSNLPNTDTAVFVEEKAEKGYLVFTITANDKDIPGNPDSTLQYTLNDFTGKHLLPSLKYYPICKHCLQKSFHIDSYQHLYHSIYSRDMYCEQTTLIKYFLSLSFTDLFEIADPSQPKVTVKGSLLNGAQSYELGITVSDEGTRPGPLSDDASLYVDIRDDNNNPPVINDPPPGSTAAKLDEVSICSLLWEHSINWTAY